jgi:N-acetylneuraminic acid mutarotase
MLWLFGGSGVDGTGTAGPLNDLWKFDGTNWTWVSGGSVANQAGTYGTKGIPSSSNNPGGRTESAAWADASDNLWLFGGTADDSTGASGNINDLWRYRP